MESKSLQDVIEAKRVFNEKFQRESLSIFNEEWNYLENEINSLLCKFMNDTVSYNSEGARSYDINKCQQILFTSLIYNIPQFQEYAQALHQMNIGLKLVNSQKNHYRIVVKSILKNVYEHPEFIVTIYY